MLVELKWPTLQNQRKAARITVLQKITAGTAKVACDDLQQLPLYQPEPEEDRRLTSNESPAEQTTAFFPRPPGTGTTHNYSIADKDPAPFPDSPSPALGVWLFH